MFSETNFREQTPYLLIFEYCKTSVLPSGSKKRNFGFWKFYHKLHDHRHSLPLCKTRCSLIYNYFVIFVLTWTKSGIITSMTLLRGLKVRITTDRKGRHTLLLGFPLYINLKQQMAVFMDGSFCLAGEHNRFALTSLKNGLRVRITADKKDRYTLLLGFPYFINLEQQLTVAWKDCFASQFHIIVSLNMLTLTISKKETSSRLNPLYHFQNKVQPAYT